MHLGKRTEIETDATNVEYVVIYPHAYKYGAGVSCVLHIDTP